MNDYGRYKRTRQSPQVADVPATLQPVRTIDETPIIHSNNVVQQTSKDTGSELEAEIWSFDRAINEVFRLLPQEEEHTPAKPLSGNEHNGVACYSIISSSAVKTTVKCFKVYSE